MNDIRRKQRSDRTILARGSCDRCVVSDGDTSSASLKLAGYHVQWLEMRALDRELFRAVKKGSHGSATLKKNIYRQILAYEVSK